MTCGEMLFVMSNLDKHLHSMNHEKHLYALHALPTHLVSAKQMELLWLVLTNFSFIEAKNGNRITGY